MIVLLVALAGGLGAVARFVLDGVITARPHRAQGFPTGVMVINVSGSLLLGIVAGLATASLPDPLHQILGAGFLGGYTTFSTAAVDTVLLYRLRRSLPALVNGLGMLLLSVVAAAAGWVLGGAGDLPR